MASHPTPRRDPTAAGRRTRSGWYTVRPSPSAACFTGDAAAFCPRPRGRSGGVSTAATSCPARTMASSVGTAKAGVPSNTRRIRANLPNRAVWCLSATPPGPEGAPSGLRSEPDRGTLWVRSGFPQEHKISRSRRLAPVPGALQLLDLALHQVALEHADVGDVQLPVEVLGLVQERARQQILGGLLEHLAPRILRPYDDAAAAPYLLAESGNT